MEKVGEIEKRKVFKDFVKNLESEGYFVFQTVVYCPDYGIPQNLRRLVLLASKLGEIGIIPKTHSPSRHHTTLPELANNNAVQINNCRLIK